MLDGHHWMQMEMHIFKYKELHPQTHKANKWISHMVCSRTLHQGKQCCVVKCNKWSSNKMYQSKSALFQRASVIKLLSCLFASIHHCHLVATIGYCLWKQNWHSLKTEALKSEWDQHSHGPLAVMEPSSFLWLPFLNTQVRKFKPDKSPTERERTADHLCKTSEHFCN